LGPLREWLGNNHGGDRMLEDQLFLIVGFQNYGILIEALDASRELDPLIR
jgi:hypothetical protein